MNNYLLFVLLLLVGACTNADTATATGTPPAASSQAAAIPTANVTKNTTTTRPSTPAEAPNIRIKIVGGQPSPVRLIGMVGEQQYLADSARMDANGVLVFKKNEPYRAGLLYVVLEKEGAFQMLIDTDQTFSMTTNINDLNGAMQVEGNLDNELLYKSLKLETAIQAKSTPVNQQMKGLDKSSPQYTTLKTQRDKLLAERKNGLNALFQQYPNSFFTAFKRAGQNPTIKDIRYADGTLNEPAQVYAYRQEFWDNVDFSDERLMNTPVISNKLKRYITELTPQHPDSIISSAAFLVDKTLPHKAYFQYFANWITLNYDPKKTTIMAPQAVFTYMIQNYFTEERAFWSTPAEIQGLQLRAYEMAASLVGKKGPNVTAKNPKGQDKSIYDMTADYIVVYMYNPDCEHCQEQTPKLVKFYNEWKSRGVDVYAIAIDTDPQKWSDYIAKTGMTFTNVHDPTNRAIYATYFVDQTPELYVLNKDRIIIGKNLKVNQIETIINRDKS